MSRDLRQPTEHSGRDRLAAWVAAELDRIAAPLLCIAVVFRTMVVIGRRLTFSPYGFDEQWFVWGGWSILQGLAPYRDFHDYKPPCLFLSEAAAIALFGAERQAFRLFFLLLAIAAVAAVTLALLRRGAGPLLSLAIGLMIAGSYLDPRYHDTCINDAESIGLAYYLFGLALLMSARERPSLQAVGTACLVVCVLTKEPYVFVAFPTWLAFLFDPSDPARRTRPLVSYVGASLVGGAVPALLVLAYLESSGSLGEYLNGYSRTLIFADTYAVLIHRFSPGSFWQEKAQMWRYLSDGLFSFRRLTRWIPLVLIGLAATRRADAVRVLCGGLAIVGSAYAISLGHCFWSHYFIMGFAALALVAVLSGLQVVGRLGDRRHLDIAGAILIMLQYPILQPHYAYGASTPNYVFLPPTAPFVLDYVAKNTGANDYILSTTPGLYFYAKRRGALTYNAFLDEVIPTLPGKTDTERFARLRAQLEEHMPAIVYIEPRDQDRNKRFLDTLVRPFMRAHRYTLVKDDLYVRPN